MGPKGPPDRRWLSSPRRKGPGVCPGAGKGVTVDTPSDPAATAAESSDAAPATDAPPPAPALGRRPALDGIRGIAIVLVLLIHSGNSLWPAEQSLLAKNGALGVHLFFVLSGFLITTLLLSEHRRTGAIRVGDFAVRRARRLLPALIALILVLGLIAATGHRLRVAQVASSGVYVLTFTSNWAMRGHAFPFVNRFTGGGGMVVETIHTWSLAIEAQYYALWAVALWAATRA